MSQLRYPRSLAFGVLMVLLTTLPAASGIAEAPVVKLRLVTVVSHVTVERFAGDPALFLPAGVYLAATGASFELDVRQASSGAVTIWQVRRSGGSTHRIRRISPAGPVNVADGLPAFFHVVMRNSRGRAVSSGDAALCPAGFSAGRVDASGPDQPGYPDSCGTALTQATVWGIDKGWASAVNAMLPDPKVADGEFTLSVSISDSYAHQLRVDPHLASVTIGATLTTSAEPPPCPAPPCILAARTTARTAAAAAPREGAVRLANAQGPHPAVVAPHANGLPDLAALPAHDLAIENGADGRDRLDFAATIWNAGAGPLVIEGFRRGPSATMAATQFIYTDGVPHRSRPAGSFSYDPRAGHEHWHYADIARYDLLDSAGSRLILSDKQSFCLAPTDPVDLSHPGADWHPDRIGLWSACSGPEAIWLREVLPAGWGDTYTQTLPGQSFDITDLPNARYKLRVVTNPAHTLTETSSGNNTSQISIQLGGTPGARTVKIVS